MDISRRRERQLHKLQDSWQGLWLRQRDLLEEAGDLMREAGHQAADITREEVYPRARATVSRVVAPALDRIPRWRKEPEPRLGAGAYTLMVVGAVALAGVAYAVWQTLRADEDLWVEDEEL